MALTSQQRRRLKRQNSTSIGTVPTVSPSGRKPPPLSIKRPISDSTGVPSGLPHTHGHNPRPTPAPSSAGATSDAPAPVAYPPAPSSSGTASYPVPSTVPAANYVNPASRYAQLQRLMPNTSINRNRGPGAVLARVLGQIKDPNARKLAPAAVAASRKTGVPASVLLALSGQESGYGTNTGPSSAGAQGITQFMPATRATMIQQHGVDPWKGPKQAFLATGYLLSDSGFKSDPQGALSSYSGGYAAGSYNNPILAQAQQFRKLGLDRAASSGAKIGSLGAGTASINQHGKGPYVLPWGGGIQQGRTDMGVDPYGTGPVRAIGKAKVLATPAQGAGSGWPAEQQGSGLGVVYKLLKGPLKGKKIYTYEGAASNTPVKQGDILHKGQVFGHSTADYETGYAQGKRGGYAPVAQRGDQPPIPPSHDNTQAGLAFASLIDALKNGGRYPTNLHDPSGSTASTSASYATGGGYTSTGFAPSGGGSYSGTPVTGSVGTVPTATSGLTSRNRVGSVGSSLPPSLPFAAQLPMPKVDLTPGGSEADTLAAQQSASQSSSGSPLSGNLSPQDILSILSGQSSTPLTPRKRLRTR